MRCRMSNTNGRLTLSSTGPRSVPSAGAGPRPIQQGSSGTAATATADLQGTVKLALGSFDIVLFYLGSSSPFHRIEGGRPADRLRRALKTSTPASGLCIFISCKLPKLCPTRASLRNCKSEAPHKAAARIPVS
jgi:hypothetical protein